MDFFRNQWNPINQPSRPRYPATARGVPVHPVPPRNAPTTKPATSPKVVHIPVHFVGSEQKRSTSAVKIQKVFRGHLVRKSVKKVASIRRDVEQVEKAISRREVVDSIRRDPKERMRLNETLMSLLFKLDSVRGVDSGVRDFRKAVIKKAIALQERVDDIASGNETINVVEEDRRESDVVETLEIDEQIPEIDASQIGEKKEKEETLEMEDQNPQIESNQGGPVVEEEPVVREEMLSIKDGGELSGIGGEEDMELAKSGEDEDDAISCGNNNSEKKCEEEEEGGCCAPEKMDISEYVIVDDKVEDGEKMDTRVDPANEVMEEIVAPVLMNHRQSADEVEKQGDNNKTTEVMLEKMMEENEKMMRMMKQLFESNEMQTRMINSLSQRVGQLEKAFVCDRLRRKKRQGGGGGDGSGSSPDQKKFGKR